MLHDAYREQDERSRGELRDDDEPDAVTGNPFRPIGEELAAAKVNMCHPFLKS